jgi:hypothetical protein
VIDELAAEGIPAFHIGRVEEGPGVVVDNAGQPVMRPARDEIAHLFE